MADFYVGNLQNIYGRLGLQFFFYFYFYFVFNVCAIWKWGHLLKVACSLRFSGAPPVLTRIIRTAILVATSASQG